MSKDSDFPQNYNFDPTILPVHGAFEVREGGARDELVTLTRTGRLLQPDDSIMPAVLRLPFDLEVGEIPYILHSANALGDKTFDDDLEVIQAFQQSHPGTPVYSLTKQSPTEVAHEKERRIEAGKSPITHRHLTINHNEAINLGIALEPSEGADAEFWTNALRRTLAIVDRDGRIASIEQPDDQKAALDIPKIRDALDAQLARLFHITRQQDQHSRMYGIATDSPNPPDPLSRTREQLMDSADLNYARLHKAGKLDDDGPFEFPSVAAARMQREAEQENRPPEIAQSCWRDGKYDGMKEFKDPEIMMAAMPVGSVAIFEGVNDNDMLDGSYTATWLRPCDLADARRYVQQAGESTSISGPGEDDGIYTTREIWLKETAGIITEIRAHGPQL